MNTPPLRESHAAVALIRRPTPHGWAYLCQWSHSWQALHFIGGHREAGESFYDCAVREMEEELALPRHEFAVPAAPVVELDYVTYSESARQMTRYATAIFAVGLTPAIEAQANRDPANGWVNMDDIGRGTAHDGRRISPTVALLLGKLEQHAAS